MPTIGFEIKRKCKVCGKVFVAKTLDSHYCSPKCGKVAWKRKKDAKDRKAKLEAIARQVSDIREYISVKEAVAMFGVERSTLYRLIKLGRIPTINMGTRLTRIKRSEMERLFLNRPESIAEKEKPAPKIYSLEPEDCYTITEICEKYHINDSSVWAHVRSIISKRHPNSSDSIIVNWRRVGELLKMYSQGQPILFKVISVKLLEDIKMFLLRAPMGGNKKGTISQNTASTYFSILKAGLKQAFIDEYLTVDISAKVKGITNIEKPRVALTMNEVQILVDTPCKDDVLKRAFLFSILTGLRHSDIQTLKWQQIQQTSKGTWQAVVVQQKTKRPDYKPAIQQALQLCGERPSDDEAHVFEGLTDASWISRPLKVWIEASGIKKHITFHCGRHSYASLLLENGVDIYTIKSLMGHTNVKTTQIYTHIVNEQKEKAANTLNIQIE